MTQDGDSLDALGIRFGTDKSSRGHNYLPLYEPFLAGLRDHPLKILEVGVLNGASLLTWQAYFPNASIVGADINPAVLTYSGERIHIEILDQSNIQELTDLALRHGPFDLVVEDGSHLWEHQITTLRQLLPHVKGGGLYIVEDLQTNYGTYVEKYRGVASYSCMDYLKRLVDLKVADLRANLREEEDAFLRTYAPLVDSILFGRHCCIIRKSAPPMQAEPFADLGTADALTVVVSANLGAKRHAVGPRGAIRSTPAQQPVSAFSLLVQGGTPVLEYSARLPDGGWTDWVPEKTIIGTGDAQQALTGFSVRLRPEVEGGLRLRVAGLFQGSEAPVLAGPGEACTTDGKAALRGIQVTLTPFGG